MVVHFKDVWSVVVPLNIKIFSWQLILDKLSSSIHIAARKNPSNGGCALGGAPDDASHIFFTCLLASFSWSVMR
jgi:hypothetical protein